MAIIIKRSAAEQDLEDLAIYIGQSSPSAAVRFLLAAERTFEQLAAIRGLGSPFPLANPQLQEIRHYPVKGFPNHIIFYLPQSGGIEVVRVLHGSRHLTKLLEGNT
jgi:plasmid stabilization system protein ParE